MKCSVTFRHMKPSDPIREYVEEKIDKLGKLLDKKGEAHVVLSVEKRFHVAHIDLITAGAHRILADERCEDMYGSIDMAVEKLQRQLRRFRDKTRDHHRENASKGRELSLQILKPNRDVESEEIRDKPAIVRQDSIVAREMNVDDALIQMDLLNSDFLVFTDSTSNRLNVMYRMPDGHFGLIEAHSPPM